MTDKENIESTEEPALQELTRAELVQEKISILLEELNSAYNEKYDSDNAEKTSAGFLSAQIDLAYFISAIELSARQARRELERVTSEVYFQLKSAATGKVTETSLQQELHRHADILKAKSDHNEAEAEVKKWNLMFGILKDGHIFFRNIGKGKNEWG